MQPQLTPKVPGAGPNVLVMDDSAMMRRFIKRVTSVADVPIGTVFEAADGCEALAIREQDDIRFVFTDINMPVMTGTELLRAMHERPEWQHIVHIIISADGSQGSTTRFRPSSSARSPNRARRRESRHCASAPSTSSASRTTRWRWPRAPNGAPNGSARCASGRSG